ncbi:MAG: MFS transporter [Chloroflexi bacterium]|nr:MFS transporter [Chloroflexota bacterium]
MALTRVTSRGRLFHGWYIVMVAIIANATTSIGNYGFGPFVNPMRDSLGWSRTSLSWALTIRVILNMFAGPVMGTLVDRKHGAMVLMMGGGIALGAALMLTSGVRELWQFYLLFGIASGLASMAVGPELINPTIISKWFVRQRGRAIAISSVGNNLGGVIFIPLTAFIILNFGWREAWLILGAIALVLIAPLSGLFIRRTPEDVGLFPDGDAYSRVSDITAASKRTDLATEYDWTLREAAGTPALWLIIATISLSGMGLGGLPIHVFPALTDKGYTTAYAAALITLFSIIVIVVKPIWGLLGERVQVRYLMMAASAIAAVGMLLLIVIKSGPIILLFPLIYGVGVSAFQPLVNLMWANYFGRASLGTIKGIFFPVTQVTIALSPVFAGIIFDATGNYDIAFITFTLCYVLSVVTLFMARRPRARLESPVRPATD